jgi:hypothetical protein
MRGHVLSAVIFEQNPAQGDQLSFAFAPARRFVFEFLMLEPQREFQVLGDRSVDS